MGNLLRALSRLDGAGDWCGGSGGDGGCGDVFVDFEDARPENEEDAAVYGRAEAVILKSEEVLQSLKMYKGKHYTCTK